MPAFNVVFQVYCDTCGNGLCTQTKVQYSDGRSAEPTIRVAPCQKCLDAALARERRVSDALATAYAGACVLLLRQDPVRSPADVRKWAESEADKEAKTK